MKAKLDDFPKINTGNGFANDLAATTNDRLERTVKALLLVEETTKNESKDTRKTISKLTQTIQELDVKNGKLQKAIFWLTVVTVILALIQVCGLIYQIYLESI